MWLALPALSAADYENSRFRISPPCSFAGGPCQIYFDQISPSRGPPRLRHPSKNSLPAPPSFSIHLRPKFCDRLFTLTLILLHSRRVSPKAAQPLESVLYNFNCAVKILTWDQSYLHAFEDLPSHHVSYQRPSQRSNVFSQPRRSFPECSLYINIAEILELEAFE